MAVILLQVDAKVVRTIWKIQYRQSIYIDCNPIQAEEQKFILYILNYLF